MATPTRPKGKPKPQRRTQEERRTATQTALLDATVECLIEYGYSGVTTTKIVERAGVSRGAQVHHFPTKAALVAAAVSHLAARRTAELMAELERLPPGEERLEAVLDMLWAQHNDRLFHAALELYVAARTDAELRDALIGVERDVNRRIWEGAELLFGEYASRPHFRDNVETALAAVRGQALLATITGNPREQKRRWNAMRARLRAMSDAD